MIFSESLLLHKIISLPYRLLSSKKNIVFYSPVKYQSIHLNSIIKALSIEKSLELKRDYVQQYSANIYRKGKFDFLRFTCEENYLKRTPSISTTEIIEIIKEK